MEVVPDPTGIEQLEVRAPEFDASFHVNGNCPVQAFGEVRGRELYFRARHGGWSFDIADSAGHLPSDGFMNSDGFYREADFPNAGWMPHLEAVAIIERCLLEYTSQR